MAGGASMSPARPSWVCWPYRQRSLPWRRLLHGSVSGRADHGCTSPSTSYSSVHKPASRGQSTTSTDNHPTANNQTFSFLTALLWRFFYLKEHMVGVFSGFLQVGCRVAAGFFRRCGALHAGAVFVAPMTEDAGV